ncbi:unnamed protein product, partial [Pocillopora meandrina]
MINPTWGLCILLVIALSIVALSVAIYNMCNVDHCNNLIYFYILAFAMKETTAVGTALAEKVIVPQASVTGMDSEIAATFVAVSATVDAAVAAVEAVAIALAVNCNNRAVLRGNPTAALPSAFHETSRR